MTHLPVRGEVWWCEIAEIGRRPVVVPVARRRDPTTSPCAHRPTAPPRPGTSPARLLEPGEDPVPLRSAVNLDAIERSRLRSSSSVWVGWPMPACARSAPPSRSRSTVQTEPRGRRGALGGLAVRVCAPDDPADELRLPATVAEAAYLRERLGATRVKPEGEAVRKVLSKPGSSTSSTSPATATPAEVPDRQGCRCLRQLPSPAPQSREVELRRPGRAGPGGFAGSAG